MDAPKSNEEARGALAHDVLGWQHRSLKGLFEPRSIALVGATEKAGSVGQALLENLSPGSYSGRLYPVNPKHPTVGGLTAYKDLSTLPETPDLVVIATPAPTVPGVVEEAAARGIRNAIVISAGFKEAGEPGVELERRIAAAAGRTGMRVLGPNCLGLMRPPSGLNATFAKPMALPGGVAFLSQSGALLSSVLDWGLERGVGFSAFVSMGSMLDLSWGDFFDYLGSDPATQCILLYMETVGDARAFMSAAREVALAKPIIALKAGRSAAGAKAAASHTGSLAGSDDVMDAAFRRCGVLRVDTIAELFNLAEAISKQGRPKGKRLAIVTNAGGPGVLATDALLQGGGEVATLDPATLMRLDKELPAHWSHGDPVDVLGDAGPERYARALETVGADPGADATLVILTPQAMSDSAGTAMAVAAAAPGTGKPVLASWMGGREAGKGAEVLRRAGIPSFAYPDTAAAIFNRLWRHHEDLAALYETPQSVDDGSRRGRAAAAGLVDSVRSTGRTLMTETESKALLSAYGIGVVDTRVASTPEEAVTAAVGLGYPVAVKLNSLTLTHKSDVGGVKLGLGDAAAVRRAYAEIRASVEAKHGQGHFQGVAVQPMVRHEGFELILGASVDPQFGPTLLFGAGGTLVEVFRDRALGLPPLNTTLARRMMEGTRVLQALKGVRGRKSVDLAGLEQILVRLSQLILDHPQIRELDLNPLLAGEAGIVALDARVVLHEPSTPVADLPKPAIRPYPWEYAGTWTARDGQEYSLRPVRPEDEPRLAEFHKTLEGDPGYRDYLDRLRLPEGSAHEKLLRLCLNDFDRQITLVAERGGPIVGVARLTRSGGGAREAEFAVQVAGGARGSGLGTELLGRLVAIARKEGVRRLQAGIQEGEAAMRAVCARLGFRIAAAGEGSTAVLELAPPD